MRSPVVVLVLALSLAGCSGTAEESASAPASAAASPSPTADPAPEVGSCHQLSLEQAASPDGTTGRDVPCSQEHTAVTVAVEPVDLVTDGHLLAVDSQAAQRRLRDACEPRIAWAGGDETTRRLSRLEVVWFTPTADQVAAGADWVRCDLVAIGSQSRLLPLPGRARDVLARPDALDTFGTCGSASPAADGFERVACAEPHRWRAVDVVDLPADARFQAAGVTDTADAACQDIASARADGSLELTWAFEWPTRDQWLAGQRWGWCWVPTSS